MAGKLLPPEKLKELKEIFHLFDIKKQSVMETKDLGRVCSCLGLDVEDDELNDMINEADPEANGSFDYEQFLQIMVPKIREQDPREELRNAFKVLDPEGTGQVSTLSLRYILTSFGEKFSDDDVDDIIVEGDMDAEGKLNIEGLVELMFSCDETEA